ncbi:MAG: serine acetyltransferase [Clostridia bacterium]
MKKIIIILNIWRLLIPIYFWTTNKNIKNILKQDLDKLSYAIPNTHKMIGFLQALIFNLPFRAVFYYRINDYKAIREFQKLLLPNKREIEISGDIKGGLVIFHGQATVFHCHSAGENLSVFQSVTVGKNPSCSDNGRIIPIIGDNVNIYTGSILIGGITVGNNVDIAANSVVINDIPDNCVVAGSPAKIVKIKETI